ncbi:MAG TPA: hypothetical protein ENI96_08905 [Sedimenticola thiotaurini]|uniref:ParB C-terminal dimerisation domain-containing protein n=1 Tax=Sedimenticola thiotaurini TaxID=1543721 RepID=A0A831RKS2_9GAMM|nr:hypothetical protein [Sedimenticola thiotaurini]
MLPARDRGVSGLLKPARQQRPEQWVGEIVGAETRADDEPERGRGRISFSFHSLEALDGIQERLGHRP